MPKRKGLEKELVDFFTPDEKLACTLLSNYPAKIPSEAKKKKSERYYKIDDSMDKKTWAVYGLEYPKLQEVLKQNNEVVGDYEVRNSKTGDVLEVVKK